MNGLEMKQLAATGYLTWLFLLLLLVATAFVYYPGLSGPLILDDISNIQNNTLLAMDSLGVEEVAQAASSNVTEKGSSPLVMVSLALDKYFLGDDVFWAKATNLTIHLANGILIFIFLRMLVTLAGAEQGRKYSENIAAWFALCITAAWLLHPMNVSAVLYVMQRTTLLSTLCMLLSLIAYMKGRICWGSSVKTVPVAWFLGATVFAVASVLSQETALLLPIYLVLLEWLVFVPLFNARKGKENRVSISMLAWLILLLVGGIGYLWWDQSQMAFEGQSLGVIQILLTEARVLFYYIGLILLPRPGEFGLFHDDIVLSTGLFSPVSTIVFLSMLLGLVWFAVRKHRKYALLSFGVFFFLLPHLVEALIAPAGLAQEQRNYLGSVGIFLAIVMLLFSAKTLLLSPVTRVLVVVSFCVFFGAVTHGRVLAWQSQNRLAMTMVNNHPDSAKSNYQAALAYTELWLDTMLAKDQRAEFKQLSVDHFTKSAILEPGDAGSLLAVLLMEGADNNANKKAMFNNMFGGKKRRAVPLVIDQQTMQDLSRRLREQPPNEMLVENLLRASRCERSKSCLYKPGEIDQLFDDLLANPFLGKETYRRAVILNELALRKYVANDFIVAQKLIDQALAISPGSARFKLDAAVILASSNQVEKALKYIEDVLSASPSDAVKERAEKMLETLKQNGKKP